MPLKLKMRMPLLALGFSGLFSAFLPGAIAQTTTQTSEPVQPAANSKTTITRTYTRRITSDGQTIILPDASTSQPTTHSAPNGPQSSVQSQTATGYSSPYQAGSTPSGSQIVTTRTYTRTLPGRTYTSTSGQPPAKSTYPPTSQQTSGQSISVYQPQSTPVIRTVNPPSVTRQPYTPTTSPVTETTSRPVTETRQITSPAAQRPEVIDRQAAITTRPRPEIVEPVSVPATVRTLSKPVQNPDTSPPEETDHMTALKDKLPSTPAGVVPDNHTVHALLWATNFNIELAVTKSDYSLLWQSLSPRLQSELTQEALRQQMADLRRNGLDLKPTIGQPVRFEVAPHLLSDGRLRLRGSFDTPPNGVRFDLLYVHHNDLWRLDAIAFAQGEQSKN